MPDPSDHAEAIADCPHCQKPDPLCICDSVAPVENRIALLILQHPQEQDRALGTARLAALHFENAVVKVADLDTSSEIVAIDRKGAVEADQRGILRDIEGVVLLDGTWSQAKALWWRNPWMLKCQRVILGPSRPSRYGKLRREPRRDGLSTLEAAAMLLARLENRPDIAATLHARFERMLARYRQVQAELPALAPKPRRRRGFYRGRRG